MSSKQFDRWVEGLSNNFTIHTDNFQGNFDNWIENLVYQKGRNYRNHRCRTIIDIQKTHNNI